MKVTQKTEKKVIEITRTVIIISILDFLRWLQEKNAQAQYLKAISYRHPDHPLSPLEDGTKPSEWVIHSFVWSSSDQGHEYWSKLDKQWRRHLDQLAEEHPGEVIIDGEKEQD